MRLALAALGLASLAVACQRRVAADTTAAPACRVAGVDTLGGRLTYVTFIIDSTRRETVRSISTGPHSPGRVLDSLALRPEEIATLQVIKPSEAAARYGVCPGYGAVLVTTKQPSPAAP
jgi:hypothetical protein